jgi:hypothetical protein
MARQGRHVPLKLSDMCLALNMAKMAKGRFSQCSKEETQYLIKKFRAKIREEKMWGVEVCGHNIVNAATERYPAMLHRNCSPGCRSCHNATTTFRRHAGDSKEQLQLCPELHPAQQVTLLEHTIPISSILRLDIRIHIHFFPVANLQSSKHPPRIASMIPIVIQICCLLKEQSLGSTLSRVW